MKVHWYSSAIAHAEDKAQCIYTVAEQEVGTVEFSNVPESSPEDVLMKANLGGIKYERESGSALLCGGASGEATLTSESTLRAKNESREYVGLMVG